MVESHGVAGQIAVSHNFKEQLELEAPNEVEYSFHETIHFMSLSKESNDLFTYLTQPAQLEQNENSKTKLKIQILSTFSSRQKFQFVS